VGKARGKMGTERQRKLNADKDIYKREQRKIQQSKVRGRGREKIVLYDKFAYFRGNLNFANIYIKKINPVRMSRVFDVTVRDVTFPAYSSDTLNHIYNTLL
jgi:hypothetical protein